MIVFKSMFNDVLLGEKSSSSRCLHVEDGGELPRLSACLPEELGDIPCPASLADGPEPGHSSLSTRRGFAQDCGWLLKKFFREAGLEDLQWSPPTVPSP